MNSVFFKKWFMKHASESLIQPEAYLFTLEALRETVKKLKSPRHVSGRELLEGIRIHAINQYGRFARNVLNHWGVHTTMDIGKIVFNLVDLKVLRIQKGDRMEDFDSVYDFADAFDRAYPFGNDHE